MIQPDSLCSAIGWLEELTMHKKGSKFLKETAPKMFIIWGLDESTNTIEIMLNR